MDYRDRHVVVTGGTGALGTAMVTALVAAGAVCHVPYILAAEAERFPLRHHAQVRLVADVELTEEAAVAKLYDGVPKLWASIHIAGGFAMAPVAETTKFALMQQVDMNFVARRAVVAHCLPIQIGGYRELRRWRSLPCVSSSSGGGVSTLSITSTGSTTFSGCSLNPSSPRPGQYWVPSV